MVEDTRVFYQAKGKGETELTFVRWSAKGLTVIAPKDDEMNPGGNWTMPKAVVTSCLTRCIMRIEGYRPDWAAGETQ